MKGNLKKRGEAFMKADAAAQKKHGIVRIQQMVFPGREGVPTGARFALWILKQYNARVVEGIKDNKKEE